MPCSDETTQFLDSAWIDSSVWPVSFWWVSNRSFRTNNDVEKWHRRINDRADGSANLPFYLLMRLLQRKLVDDNQKKPSKLGLEYKSGNVSMKKLLKKYGSLYSEKEFVLWHCSTRGADTGYSQHPSYLIKIGYSPILFVKTLFTVLRTFFHWCNPSQ